MHWLRAALALAPLLLAALPSPPAATTRPERERGEIHDRIVRAKLDRVLGPAMKANGVSMWIVLVREDAVDPLFPFVSHDGAYAGSRNAWVFVDDGGPRPRRIQVGDEMRGPFADEAIEPRPGELGKALRALADRYRPRRIALDVALDTPAADGLSASLRDWLVKELGPHARKVASAEGLVRDYLGTRLPEELPLFAEAARVTESVWGEALSARAIRPGETTVGDLLWFVRQRYADLHVGSWFRPDVRVQRQGLKFDPADAAPADLVIRPGDVVHLDLGIVYLGFATDYQRMAYVPRDGEQEVPPGLARALAATNRLQDLLVAEMRAGRAGREVAAAALARAKAEGLEPMIYSHSVGNFGHCVGASIGSFMPGARPGPRARLPLRDGAYTAIELAARTAVPEWAGQEVVVMMEDDAWLAPEGMRYFVPRQTSWIVVR